MKFGVNKQQLSCNIKVLMNRLGYHQHLDRRSNQASYAKRLARLVYPRFHVYIRESSKNIFFNIHLDEKQPSYGVGHRHSGQYEGDLVATEVNRIHEYIKKMDTAD